MLSILLPVLKISPVLDVYLWSPRLRLSIPLVSSIPNLTILFKSFNCSLSKQQLGIVKKTKSYLNKIYSFHTSMSNETWNSEGPDNTAYLASPSTTTQTLWLYNLPVSGGSWQSRKSRGSGQMRQLAQTRGKSGDSETVEWGQLLYLDTENRHSVLGTQYWYVNYHHLTPFSHTPFPWPWPGGK